MKSEKTRSVIRLVAGIYLGYLGVQLLNKESREAGFMMPIVGVIFILCAAFVVWKSIKPMLEDGQISLEGPDADAIEADAEEAADEDDAIEDKADEIVNEVSDTVDAIEADAAQATVEAEICEELNEEDTAAQTTVEAEAEIAEAEICEELNEEDTAAQAAVEAEAEIAEADESAAGESSEEVE